MTMAASSMRLPRSSGTKILEDKEKAVEMAADRKDWTIASKIAKLKAFTKNAKIPFEFDV